MLTPKAAAPCSGEGPYPFFLEPEALADSPELMDDHDSVNPMKVAVESERFETPAWEHPVCSRFSGAFVLLFSCETPL